MADAFIITPPTVRAEGKDVPPEQIQAGFNSLARQTQIGLNSVASDPTGPAGGDLGGTYPNPTVVGAHITTGAINGTTVGQTTPAAGAFTTLTATTPVAVTSGGTGQNALNAHNVIIGEGSSAVGFAAPGAAGQMLISAGAAVDPAFANNPVITGGTIDNAPIGGTTKAAGSFTTIVATGTITPSSTNGIVGTATNDNANAGSVGEYVTATGTAVSLTSGTPANVASISLTAGDWEISGNNQFNPAGTTTVSIIATGASTVSATLPAVPNLSLLQTTFTTGAQQTVIVPPQRISIASTTTVFLVAQCNFGTSTCTATGIIRARRVR